MVMVFTLTFEEIMRILVAADFDYFYHTYTLFNYIYLIFYVPEEPI